MPIVFHHVDHAIDALPQLRFVPARVTSGQPFRWHRFAAPAPAYWLCLVQIVEIQGADRIRVQCFDHNGVLTGAPFDVNLADRDHAWPTAPSTIAPLPETTAGLGPDACAVLCLTESLLRVNHVFGAAFVKYPYGEQEAEQENSRLREAERENTRLRSALSSLRDLVGAAAFDPIATANNVEM
jgi:hypothetical protein